MITTLPVGGGGKPILAGTLATILAASPASYIGAISTDTLFFYASDGTAWREVGPVNIKAVTPDMGAYQDSPLSGYAEDFIDGKEIYNSRILGNAYSREGDVKTVAGTLYVYLNGTWATVVTGFRFREDATGNYEMEHMPIGFTGWYSLASGNSDALGLDGYPLIQQYSVNMGAYGTKLIIDGGES
jgi:hypothetical protein